MSTWLSGALRQVTSLEPEHQLWAGVVFRALRDLEAPPGTVAHQDARQALEDDYNLAVLADLAGMDRSALRRVARAMLAGWRPPTVREWDRRSGVAR